MANLDPLHREDLPELEELFRHYDDTLGFVPNSLYTMARRPEILRAFSDLITKIWRTGTLPIELKPLIAIVSSQSAGCRYCQAHEAVDARERGVDSDKIAAVWEFETSPLYSEAERSALRMARDASLQPSMARPEHFDALREHYTEGEIVEIMAVVSLFGFLNRWNDTMATDLEVEPFTFASDTYDPGRWTPGKHRVVEGNRSA
ncbi:MAG: carboxymuconolactone decarboxylase family protein [Acidimicrobiia bacterium]